jgi:hypothetical protein
MDQELAVKPEVKKGIESLTKYANDVQITDVKIASDVGINLSKIADLKKAVEDQRTEITKPLNLSLKSINSFFKKFSDPLEVIDKQLRGKVIEFGKTTEEKVFGVIHFRKNQVIKVVDETKVPNKFYSVDMAKIKKAISDGEEIPGVEVTEENSVSL